MFNIFHHLPRLFSYDMAVDLGTANTLVYVKGLPHLRIGRTVRYEFQSVADWLTQNYKQNPASDGKQDGVEQ